MFIMKSKIQFYSFIFFVAFFSCTENNPSSIVGEAVTATVKVPEEGVDLEYLWEFKNLPDNSNISNSDIQAGDDEISVIFVPDVSGNYGLEVSIFQYNDEISTQSFNFDVIGEEMVALNEDIVNIDTQILDDPPKNDEIIETDEPKWYDSESISELVIAMEKDSIISEPRVEKTPEKEVVKAPTASTKKPAPKKRTKIRGKSIPFDKNRFTIQIASKKILSDAKKIAMELIDSGYDAYIQKALFVETNETWYRIRVGSYDKKETATAVAKTLSKSRPEKAWVDYVRFER